jgi:hypothetical protein
MDFSPEYMLKVLASNSPNALEEDLRNRLGGKWFVSLALPRIQAINLDRHQNESRSVVYYWGIQDYGV